MCNEIQSHVHAYPHVSAKRKKNNTCTYETISIHYIWYTYVVRSETIRLNVNKSNFICSVTRGEEFISLKKKTHSERMRNVQKGECIAINLSLRH